MMSVEEITRYLKLFRFRFGSELILQNEVERAFQSGEIAFQREYRLGKDRVDFFAEGVAIECKVSGGLPAVLEQCMRYADRDEVSGVVLVTSRQTHRSHLQELRGKPFSVVWVAGNL